MKYQNTVTKEVITYAVLVSRYPNTSFPKDGKETLLDWNLVSETPKPDVTINQVVKESTIDYTQTWEILDLTPEEKALKLEKNKTLALNKITNDFKGITRPETQVILDSGTVIQVDAGRDDKDNFKENYILLDRLSETTSRIKDSSNILHDCTRDDIERCYLNIVNNFNIMMNLKWDKELSIQACVTLEQLEAL